MDIWDLFITPVYFVIIFIIAYIYKQRNKKNELIRKYFFSALFLRLFGSLAFGMIYQFYYGGGDTFNFWRDVKILNGEIFFEDISAYFQILFGKADPFHPDTYQYTSRLRMYIDRPSFFVIKTASLLGLFTFTTYSTTSFLFALISFSGSWKLFRTLQEQYPHLTSKLAFATLYIPSVVFWGSGIMKDTLCLVALCYLYSSFHELISYRRSVVKNILFIILSSYVLYEVKLYILLSFIPALIIWLFIRHNNNIKSKSTRNFLRPIVLSLAIITGIIGASYISSTSQNYSMENLERTSKITSSYLKRISIEQGGSVYDLGEIEFTAWGLLKIFPQGVNVTLFRPYLWESKNIVMVFSALESLFFLWLTLKVLFSNGIGTLVKKINNDAFLYSALIFSIVFAFAVGISTNNFGSLVRYKIPLLCFYLSSLYILEIPKKKRKI